MTETEAEAVEQNLQRLETQIIRFGCVFASDAKQLIELIRKEIVCPTQCSQV